MAPPGWFYGKVIDNLGLKERPPYSAKYEKHAEANKSTEVGQL